MTKLIERMKTELDTLKAAIAQGGNDYQTETGMIERFYKLRTAILSNERIQYRLNMLSLERNLLQREIEMTA